jgi:prepilin-type N-terminal cleavage/methylation domain-containing protein
MRKLGKEYSGRGFTLLELSIVLTLIGVVLTVGLTVLTAGLQASQYNATVTRMDAIEKAILSYAIANNRIPCPTDLTLTTSSASYGFEAGATAGGTGTGECVTSMTPAANFKASSGAEEGGVPTRALRLPDDYMYDGWGRKFRYAVDPTYTKSSALPIAASCGSGFIPDASAITVNDASGAARTTAGMYALISHGANGHGAYTSNGVVLNAGSVNATELTNCHCTSGAAPTTYAPSYVEMVPSQDPANALDNFDDIVTFKEPWQMQALNFPPTAANCSQYLYVTDAHGNRVEIFDMSGTYIGQIGCATGACSSGSGNGQFSGLQGAVAFDASGNIWVADNGNNRVEKFSSNGVYQSQFPCASGACAASAANGQFNWPDNIAIDSSGNLWVTDYSNNRIEKFSSSGSYITKINVSGGCGANDVVLDKSGNIWVSPDCNAGIQEFSSSGTLMQTINDWPYPQDPSQMVFDASGNLWASDWEEGGGVPVQEFNAITGAFIGSLGTQGTGNGKFSDAQGIAIDANGNFWVTDWSNNYVQKFNSSGVYQSQFGSSGSGNGQFNNASYITISSR